MSDPKKIPNHAFSVSQSEIMRKCPYTKGITYYVNAFLTRLCSGFSCRDSYFFDKVLAETKLAGILTSKRTLERATWEAVFFYQ